MSQQLGLTLSVFLACSVEAVEALTIVLAIGFTRGWRSALMGAAAATVLLAVLLAILGPALLTLPLKLLRLVVGALLLAFGLQWLSKATLRAAGLKARHDETEVFLHETQAARSAEEPDGPIDGYAFAVAFKSVLLEGLEVAFIVLTFGANQHRIGLAAAAAGAAVLLVATVGVAVRRPLARVPENAMKLGVGVMLTSFGTFWSAEGAGASWPGADAALLVLIPGTLLTTMLIASTLSGQAATSTPRAAPAGAAPAGAARSRVLRGAIGIWDFFIGEDWRAAIGILAGLCLTALVAGSDVAAWWLMPLAVLGLLARPLLHLSPRGLARR